jgi:mRNA-degrading endonuclease RelE of RelBE toxin-antitoxin system
LTIVWDAARRRKPVLAADSLPGSTRESVRRRVDEIAVDPFARHANVQRYKEGGPDNFRLRQGQWRVVCRIDRKAQQVQVQIIDTRGSVYR